MEGTTSTSNEGSKKRDLSKYQAVSVKNVKEKDLDKALKLKGFEDLDIVCAIAFDVKENVKGLNSTTSSVSSSSADSKKIDLDDIRENGVSISKGHSYTAENKPKIDRKRAAYKKKKDAEKEAREAEEEMDAIKRRKEIEKTEKDDEKRKQIKMNTNEIDDKDAI